MLEIHLYGSLRRYAPDSRPDRESVVRVEPQPKDTVGIMLEQLGISVEQVYHIFLNGALLSTKNTMAQWLKYQQPGARARGLDTPVQADDRLGLFPITMGLLVV